MKIKIRFLLIEVGKADPLSRDYREIEEEISAESPRVAWAIISDKYLAGQSPLTVGSILSVHAEKKGEWVCIDIPMSDAQEEEVLQFNIWHSYTERDNVLRLMKEERRKG